MANKLPTEKKVTVISMLAEGNSIRSIERTPKAQTTKGNDLSRCWTFRQWNRQ